jgi:hypothetical protein
LFYDLRLGGGFPWASVDNGAGVRSIVTYVYPMIDVYQNATIEDDL